MHIYFQTWLKTEIKYFHSSFKEGKKKRKKGKRKKRKKLGWKEERTMEEINKKEQSK